MNFQQQLLKRMWRPVIKREAEIYMIIKGKILTAVRLNDINKIVQFGKEVILTEYEVNRSRDLKNALRRNWVEVIYDRSMLKRAIAEQKQLREKMSEQEVIEIARTMAKSMAEEMLKNSPLVKGIAKEIAKEMIEGIKDNIKIEQVNVSQSYEKSINTNNVANKNQEDSIFIDFKDEESGITANIKKSGEVEVKKDDLTNSLEKMKRFKQSKAK